MRIVIDFQGAQTDSRYRGIGHYSREFVKALINQRGDLEIFLVLNGLLTESIEPIRAEFDGILPQENIRVWFTPGPIEQFGNDAGNLREIAEAMREFYLRSLEPDVILVTSIFEGLGDNAVVTVKKFVKDVPVVAIFYDFTPLYTPDEQFRTNPVYRRWYRERIDSLSRCDLLLAISESSRKEAIDQIGLRPQDIANIFGGRNEAFARRTYGEAERREVFRRFGITKPFILYAGGVEPSKNLKRLVHALSLLPAELQQNYEFVCVGKRNQGEVEQIQNFARDGSALEMIRITGFVDQSDLIDLYNLCDLFVFPSLREGFGLPPLEAMACGAPTIVSDRTSLPEVVKNSDALFDPISPELIASKITEVLTNRGFREMLVERGLERAGELTWEATASKATEEICKRFPSGDRLDQSRRTVVSRTGLFKANRKRLVVQKLDHHGDFLLGIPAMAKLRARYPEARIDALIGSWNRDAAQASGLFDEIHTLDFFKAKSSVQARLEEEEFGSLLRQLPFYDYAIDLRRQPDTRSILTQLKAYQYFGYRTGNELVDGMLTRPLEIHPDRGGERSYFDETHTCEQMLRIVDALPFDANDYVRLPELGERISVRPGSIAIFPKVGNDSRQWHSENFRSLIDELAKVAVVKEINLFCGRSDELDDIQFTRHSKVSIHAGLPFGELFSALSANAVCIGNNSLGVHLAGYAGCRTIGIYSGHELPQQWGPPFGESVTVSVDAACSPCHLPDRPSCPHELFCLGDISVATVKAAVLDALEGRAIAADDARITRYNPASVVKPLVDAVNKRQFLGDVHSLDDSQRVAFAAAVSINFPERISSKRCVYFDVSGLLEASVVGRSNRRLAGVQKTFDTLRKRGFARVIPIATGEHDHEFYTVDIENLERSLFTGERSERIVSPMAGDVYIGPHPYLRRNPAQWELLATWRQMGLFTIVAAPEHIEFHSLIDAADDQARVLASYLFAIGHFDAIVASEDECRSLSAWLEEFGPPRLRDISCASDLLALVDGYFGSIALGKSATKTQELSAQTASRSKVRRLVIEAPESADQRAKERLKRNGNLQ